MSDAFRCDVCDGFHSGSPAATVKVQGDSYWDGDGVGKLKPKHRGGVDDVDPVGVPDFVVEWPTDAQSKTVEFCAFCFSEHILGGIQEAFDDE